jgi:glycosyltransferase involved in cell wall biosynthesis
MRVLHLIPSLGGGGAERQITYLLGGLHAQGCDAHLGIFRGGANLGRAEASGATIHWLTESGRYDALVVWRMIRLIRSLRPDVVQTWLTPMDIAGGIASMATGTPWILSERTSDQHNPGGVRHWLRGRIGRYATAVIANSQGGLAVWPELPALKFIVPNALPLDEIEACPRDEGDYRSGARILLFVGRLDHEKNVLTLLTALRDVVAQRDAIALLCGVGPLESEVRRWIDDAGCTDQIQLLGFTDRVWTLMKRADLLVAVSRYEGHPNAVLEAAASGCPLVLSSIPAHLDCFGESAALYASPNDPREIAAQILNALDDVAGAQARAARARQIAREWSVERASAAYLKIYEQLTEAVTKR